MPVPYPIALENVEPRYPWSWSHTLLSSPLGPLLRGPCHFGPSCAEKTTALKLVLLLWIVDTVSDSMTFVMEYALNEAIKNPMDNGLTNQSPPPTPSITIDNTFGVPMVWCQARRRLQLLRRWLLCRSCIWVIFMFQRIVVLQFCGFIFIWTHSTLFESFAFY